MYLPNGQGRYYRCKYLDKISYSLFRKKRLALKLVEVKIKRNRNPDGKEGLKKR